MSDNVRSEGAVVGSMILDPRCIEVARYYIKSPEYFRSSIYAEAYERIIDMHDKGDKIDLVTVCEKFQETNKITVIAETVNSLIMASDHVEEYARIIRDRYVRRVMANKLRTIDPLSIKKYPVVLDVVNEMELLIKKAGEIVDDIKDQTIEELVGEVYDEYYMGKEWLSNRIVPTGLYDLDKIIGGLEMGENIVIAARPGMGKTSLALNIAMNVAEQGKKAIIFSLEMDRRRLVRRMLCMRARIDSNSYREQNLTEDEHGRLAVAAEELSVMPIVIVDKINTTTEIRSITARHTIRGDVGVVFIDFLQLIRDPFLKGRSRANEVGEIAKSIQRIASNYSVPVVTLSQLNRDCEKRDDKRPKRTDLYESGDIEAAADKIIFIYRDEEYNPDTKDKGIAELFVDKQRDGEKGLCKLAWLGYCMRFDNLVSGAA